jgi:hypothetical protein
VFHAVLASVQLLPAALVASSLVPVVIVLLSFPVALVVAFVLRQVVLVRCCPVVVLVLGSASSSPTLAMSRLRPRIATEVVPSPFASVVPETSPLRPFVVVVPRLVAWW